MDFCLYFNKKKNKFKKPTKPIYYEEKGTHRKDYY